MQALLKVARVPPAVNQIRFHPYNYAEQKPLLDYCAQHGVVVAAYSSLTPITRSPGGPVDVPVRAAAARIGGTPAQVLLLWARAKGVVIVTQVSPAATEWLRLTEFLQDHLQARAPAGVPCHGRPP
jgi:diketogulonate reductase-like aldo/keto reductase